MAVRFEFKLKNKLLTLLEADEYLCLETGLEVSQNEYCALYEHISILAYSAKEHNPENVDILAELDETFGDRDWYIDNHNELRDMFEEFTMTRWIE